MSYDREFRSREFRSREFEVARRRAVGPAAVLGRGRLLMGALAFFLAAIAFFAAPKAAPSGSRGDTMRNFNENPSASAPLRGMPAR